MDAIKGIGCDMVSVTRIAGLLCEEKFQNKVYTVYEQGYICQKNEQTAAGIWAAKEAVSKALGTGFNGFCMKDIEVRHSESGAPQIQLYNGAEMRAKKIGVKNIHVSISHEKQQAMAFVVVE